MHQNHRVLNSLSVMRGGDTAFNHAHIQLKADKQNLDFSGSAFESITHLIGVKQGFTTWLNSNGNYNLVC